MRGKFYLQRKDRSKPNLVFHSYDFFSSLWYRFQLWKTGLGGGEMSLSLMSLLVLSPFRMSHSVVFICVIFPFDCEFFEGRNHVLFTIVTLGLAVYIRKEQLNNCWLKAQKNLVLWYSHYVTYSVKLFCIIPFWNSLQRINSFRISPK